MGGRSFLGATDRYRSRPMTELLTHVLAGYIIGTVLSFRLDWLRAPYVTVVMVGAILPDMTKVAIVIPPESVEAVLGIPFDWFALHTPFGTVITAGIGALLVGDGHRQRVFVLLLVGGVSHFVLDAILISPSRFSSVLLWPFYTAHVPLPMLVLSSDRWPAIIAASVAGVVWFARRASQD